MKTFFKASLMSLLLITLSACSVKQETPKQEIMIQDTNTPTVTKEAEIAENYYLSDNYKISFNYPSWFSLLENDQSEWILISQESIQFPDIWGTSAPISIKTLDKKMLRDELNSFKQIKEEKILIDWLEATKYTSLSNELILIVIENKNIVIRWFESPLWVKIKFDLESVLDQIIRSIKFI